MSQDSKSNPPQSKSDKPSHSKKTIPALNVVVSNPTPAQKVSALSQLTPSKAGFTAELRNIAPMLMK
jgi:hypothetical protein